VKIITFEITCGKGGDPENPLVKQLIPCPKAYLPS
jgi:hypothetical protein